MAAKPQAIATARGPKWVLNSGLRITRGAPVISLSIIGLLIFVALFAPVLAPHEKLQPVQPTEERCMERFGFADCPYIDDVPPFWHQDGTWNTPLGTDSLGRDILTRLMYGARISLVVALTGTLVAGVVGTILGVVAGYMGGWYDQIIMRVTDAWLALPTLVFAILLSSVRGGGSIWNVVFVLAVVFWSRYARLVRAEVLSLKERDFIKLAEVTGVGTFRIMVRHLLPNVLNTVIVFFTLIVGVSIIIEASLSFLGVGVLPPEPAWGLMIAQERESLVEGKWWLAVFPGICIALLVLSVNLLGDWLRVRLDPQLRNR